MTRRGEEIDDHHFVDRTWRALDWLAPPEVAFCPTKASKPLIGAVADAFNSLTFGAMMTSHLAALAICLVLVASIMGCNKPVNDQPEFRLTEPPTQENR
jgi:hypothetical protein